MSSGDSKGAKEPCLSIDKDTKPPNEDHIRMSRYHKNDTPADSGFGSHIPPGQDNSVASMPNDNDNNDDTCIAVYMKPKQLSAKRESVMNDPNTSQDKSAEEKRTLYLQTSRTSTKSSASSKSNSSLPDVVSSSSSSSTPPAFSVIEDISNRHESSLNGPDSMNRLDEEDVFTNDEDERMFPGKGNYMDNETLQKMEPLHREFSVPGTVSDEKKESLQEIARKEHEKPTIVRSVSYHPPTYVKVRQQSEDFKFVKANVRREKYKSCSDLGSGSFGSSKDDPSTTKSKRQSYNDSSYGSREEDDSKPTNVHDRYSESVLPCIHQENDSMPTLPATLQQCEDNCYSKSNDSSVELPSGIKINRFPETFSVDAENTVPRIVEEYDMSEYLQKIREDDKLHNQYADDILKIQTFLPSRTPSPVNNQTEIVSIENKEQSVHDNFCLKLLSDITLQKSSHASIKTDHKNPIKWKPVDLDKELEKYWQSAMKTVVQNKLQKTNYDLKELEESILIWQDSDSENKNEYEVDSDTTSIVKEDVSTSNEVCSNDDNIIRCLVISTQCELETCDVNMCSWGKNMYQKMISELKDAQFNGWLYNIMEVIAEHSRNCPMEKCPVPFCDHFTEHDTADEAFGDVLVNLQREYFSQCCRLNFGLSDDQNFVPLQNGALASMPVEGVDFDVVCRLGIKNVFFVRDVCINSKDPYCIIKKSRQCEENIKDLYELKKLQHSYLVKLLWAATSQADLFTTTRYEASRTLREFMKDFHPDGLPDHILLPHLQRLSKALHFIHQHEILYLNWIAEHVMYTKEGCKLCNFGTAVTRRAITENDDLADDISGRLKSFLLPPEVLNGEVYFPESDYWGFACLVNEMRAGHHLHWDKRHLMPEEQMDLISEQYSKNKSPAVEIVKSVSKEQVKNFFENCFKLEPSNRQLLPFW